MSVDFIYLNQDKKQFFYCGILSWSSSFRHIGHGPGARALSLLLSNRGLWHYDRIAVVTDSSADFDDVFVNGINIEVEVALMLIEVDGLEWIEEELNRPTVFTRMCDFAIYYRHPEVTALLDKTFGLGKWQKKYDEYFKRSVHNELHHILEAKDRNLKLLK